MQFPSEEWLIQMSDQIRLGLKLYCRITRVPRSPPLFPIMHHLHNCGLQRNPKTLCLSHTALPHPTFFFHLTSFICIYLQHYSHSTLCYYRHTLASLFPNAVLTCTIIGASPLLAYPVNWTFSLYLILPPPLSCSHVTPANKTGELLCPLSLVNSLGKFWASTGTA